MTAHYPRIRLQGAFAGQRFSLLRERLTITFYIRRSHEEIVPELMRALDAYLQAVGPEALGWYVDPEGDWRELDPTGWAFIRNKWASPRGARVELAGAPDGLSGYGLLYEGHRLDALSASESGPVCAVSYSMPTEFLEEQGPARVRKLALEWATGLPFDSGHGGLSFQFPGWTPSNTPLLRDMSFRHPGVDIPERSLAWCIGTKLKGAHWLTFVGPSVLEALGGVEGLWTRLRSAGTAVDAVGDGRAVVTLGPWPEAGDLEADQPLLAYRELARVLNPWLYFEQRHPWGNFTPEEMRRWERRFLD